LLSSIPTGGRLFLSKFDRIQGGRLDHPIVNVAYSDAMPTQRRVTTGQDALRPDRSSTDADREYAYNHESDFGGLNKTLDETTTRHSPLVDIKTDWKKAFLPASPLHILGVK
jgi:formylglycine-generating enzyme required for sulfatase activity